MRSARNEWSTAAGMLAGGLIVAEVLLFAWPAQPGTAVDAARALPLLVALAGAWRLAKVTPPLKTRLRMFIQAACAAVAIDPLFTIGAWLVTLAAQFIPTGRTPEELRVGLRALSLFELLLMPPLAALLVTGLTLAVAARACELGDARVRRGSVWVLVVYWLATAPAVGVAAWLVLGPPHDPAGGLSLLPIALGMLAFVSRGLNAVGVVVVTVYLWAAARGLARLESMPGLPTAQ